MNTHDKTYLNMLSDVLENGELVPNRTGVDTLSILGYQCRYDLADGFPVLSSKRVAWKKSFAEMLWFISGKCDWTPEPGNPAASIWTPWARFSKIEERGYLGPIYGVQWRKWEDLNSGFVDQLGDVVSQIQSGSTSRRLIVSAWRPDEIDDMALPPCHVLFQFTVRGNKLHLQLYQRSCDLPIGGPFNVAQYSMLLCCVAKLANLEPGTFVHTIHDAHIYVNQVEGVKRWIDQQAADDEKPMSKMMRATTKATEFMKDYGINLLGTAPTLRIHGDQQTIDDFELDSFELLGYKPLARIKMPVAV